jgi:endonuclease/exonuclease/phosphatase (EEP) superfamily protein YafD
MLRRLLAAALVLAVAAAAVVAFWPQLLHLERVFGVAQVVSLRAVTAACAAVVAVGLLVIALFARSARRLAASLAVVLLLFVAATGAVLATRGAGDEPVAAADGDVTVLSWNTLGDAPGAQAIARLALDVGADIVSLPETSSGTARRVAELMAAEGRPMDARSLWYDEIAIARTTSLLISESLGAYERDATVGETRTLPSFVMRPVSGEGPVIVAAHPVAPVPGEMTAWRQGLSWLADRCAEPGVILAGDLNSTLDHYTGLGDGDGDLGRCDDAAQDVGAAAVGTWPAAAPPLLGAPIDHVMSSDGWSTVGFRVVTTLDDAGSDHRPVVAVLRPEG